VTVGVNVAVLQLSGLVTVCAAPPCSATVQLQLKPPPSPEALPALLRVTGTFTSTVPVLAIWAVGKGATAGVIVRVACVAEWTPWSSTSSLTTYDCVPLAVKVALLPDVVNGTFVAPLVIVQV